MQGTIWINKKTQQDYIVVDLAIDATNRYDSESVVVYKQAGTASPTFVREYKEFLEKFSKSYG